AFVPGQYLTLRARLDGLDLRRSYSICSGPDEAELRIAVKRVEGGPFSAWVNSELRAGDLIEVMTPTGRFGIPRGCAGLRVSLGCVACSGVTPILSIVRGVLGREPMSRFFLFYGSRSTAEVLFGEALAELKDRYMERLSVFHVLSREEQDVAILNGRLDGSKVRLLLRWLVPAAAIDDVLICGPEGMGEGLGPVLGSLGSPGWRM